MTKPTDDEVTEFAAALGLPPYSRWYRFGLRSPVVLFKRLQSTKPAVFNARFHVKMRRQRARRGWSDEDMWGLNYYLARVIAGSVREMRRIAHGHPTEMTHEQWLTILDEIAEGMDAALIMLDDWDWPEGGEEKFNRAMNHLTKWFAALWD